MNRICFILALFSFYFLATKTSLAEEDLFDVEDDTFFEQEDKKEEVQVNNFTLSNFLSTRLSETAVKNINNAEKIFCYTVDYAPADYNGYLIDDLALKGSCGELSEEGKNLIQSALLHNNAIFSTNIENCRVAPKIMLRYILGADHTDVLISSPCHSLTFFHGQEITTVNAGPGEQVIDKIVKAYSSLEEKFLSPALLGQMVANGQIITQSQKEIVRRLSPTEKPIKKWSKDSAPQNDTKTKADKNKKGWNRLQ